MGLFEFITKKFTNATSKGIWFNQERKKTEFDKEKFKEAFEEFAPKIAEILRAQQNTNTVSGLNPFNSAVDNAAELYNWLSYSGDIQFAPQNDQGFFTGITTNGQWIPAEPARVIGGNALTPPPNNFGNLVVPDKPATPAKKPKEVIDELETMVTPWSLENLDEKIAVMEDKLSLTLQRYAHAELSGMVERLKNRKKYESVKDFFKLFPNTTDEKIEELIKKYPHLKLGTSDLFVPEFPNDAVKAMKDYTQHCKDLCNKKPVFYVIAQKKDFEQKVKRRDPILLVQSPFGMYWQILGAWDEEMVLLSEL